VNFSYDAHIPKFIGRGKRVDKKFRFFPGKNGGNSYRPGQSTGNNKRNTGKNSGEQVITTFIIIIAAYGAYELLLAWARRESRLWQPKKPSRCWRKALTVSCGLGLGISYGLGLMAAASHNNVGTGKFLGAVWAGTEGQAPADLHNYFAPVSTKSGYRPAYLLLHPDFPPQQLTGLEKKSPRRRPARQPKSRQSHMPPKTAKR